jgi:YVTN family beta-propeller protein
MADRTERSRVLGVVAAMTVLLLVPALLGVLDAGLAVGARPMVVPSGPAPPPGQANSTSVIGVVATTSVGDLPTAIATDTANGWVYVANQGASDVTILNGSTTVGSVGVGEGCEGVTYDPGSGDVYVSNFRTDNVSVIDGTTRVALIPVGAQPLSMVYDPVDGYVYVIDTGSASVTILSGTSVVANDSVGQGPISGVYDPSDGWVYITSQYTELEAIFSGTTVIDELDIGLILSFDTIYDPYNGYVYVLNATEQGGRYGAHLPTALGVALIGTRRAYSFETGLGPKFGALAAVDPQNGWLYIPEAGTSTVTVVDNTTLVANVSVGASPVDALYDPADSMMYVSDQQGYAVSVLNLTTVVAQPTVGIYPIAMTFDPIDRQVFVANLGESTVSILGLVRGWEVQFVESGLPPGTLWSLNFDGVGHSSNTSTIVLYAPNGTYTYSVSPEPGFSLNNSSGVGVTTVTESGVTVSVVFTPITPPPHASKGLPLVYVYSAVIAGGIAAAIVGALYLARRSRRERPPRSKRLPRKYRDI